MCWRPGMMCGGALMCRLSKTDVWRGFDWQKQPTANPHTPIPKCVANPLADGIIARRPIARRMAPPDNCFSASGRNPRGNRAIVGRSLDDIAHPSTTVINRSESIGNSASQHSDHAQRPR